MKGKLVQDDLGTGVWVLEADDGRRFQLQGDVPDKLAGKRVEVDGQESGLFGFGMVGPTLKVKSIRPA